MDYLALVNGAIREAGKDMDALTSANFASPPNARMYERFKEWVNESYAQLQMARDEWEFKTARATVDLYPAVYVENGNRATAPPAGASYVGDDTEFSFDVVQTVTTGGVWASGTAKATLYFENMDGADFRFNELYAELSPDPASDIFLTKGWGRYNFDADGQVTDMLEPLIETFMIQDSEPDTLGLQPLTYVDWDVWEATINSMAGGRGKPAYVTTAPDGSLEFYPRPDRHYQVNFEYTVDDLSMTLYTDSPTTIAARYHPAIMWAAVIKSGMYDRDRAIVSRAQKEYDFYRDRMEKNLMPKLNFEPSRFDGE